MAMMMHPGLPLYWGIFVGVFMLIIGSWAIFVPLPLTELKQQYRYTLTQIPVIGHWFVALTATPIVLFILKLLFLLLFLLVIISGLQGTALPERNIATLLTWNIWWTGIIVSIFFIGSAWCAVCPWDTLATWLVRRRAWKRAIPSNSLNLVIPPFLRTIWFALAMFIGLTWLELGLGVTTSPYITALLALVMVILSTLSLALFERKAFCRYFCPVGRTVGFYSQLAPIELRPINIATCEKCTTLDCYHGNQTVEPCPTYLLMGNLTQNTYCTSCGNCTQSCPHHNISWRFRPQSLEAKISARPHWDEAWFMLGLLSLTAFHGITMLSVWEEWLYAFARIIGDNTRQLLWSFSIGLFASMLILLIIYAMCVTAVYYFNAEKVAFKRLFSTFAFVTLPLAFAYHLAHNLNHLLRESQGFWTVLFNPLGKGAQPLSMAEIHARHANILIPEWLLFGIQGGLMMFGFWVAVQVIRYRGHSALNTHRAFSLIPLILFAVIITVFHLWVLMQPMMMRM